MHDFTLTKKILINCPNIGKKRNINQTNEQKVKNK